MRRDNDGVVLEALPTRLCDLDVGGNPIAIRQALQESGYDAALAFVDRSVVAAQFYEPSHVSTSCIAMSSSASACSRSVNARRTLSARSVGRGGARTAAIPGGLTCGTEVPYECLSIAR